MAVIPRVGRPEAGQARYFEEHAQFASAAELSAAVARDAATANVRHAQQLLALARIVRRKYQFLRRAMQALGVALAILALAAVVGVLS
jgi:hypothetical protein